MRKPLSQLKSYQALEKHAEVTASKSMRDLFAQDQKRFASFSLQLDSLLFDYSKNRITQETLDIFAELFDECEVASWREKMFAGEQINATEKRAVQHTALRDLNNPASDIANKQHEVLQQIEAFVEKIHSSQITDVVNIGIGGSHLGPMAVCDALSDMAAPGINVHFVANVDAYEINQVLKKLSPEKTLFIVTSKSFGTQETLTNAITAKKWFEENKTASEKIEDHFVAVSANVDKAVKFGIAEQQIFPMWDEIGGRYSLWSAVGLSIALYLGTDAFRQLLQGANAMDVHFKTASAKENIPVLMALLEVWNQLLGSTAHAVLPYDTRLQYLPAYLQQLVMESNGKRIDRTGRELDVASSAVVFGDVGTNAQHSFFQLLHQGTQAISCDFIAVAKLSHENKTQHEMLLANMFAQTQALMLGQTLEEAQAQGDDEDAEHRIFPGNRVSNTILLTELTPYSLGLLLSMYEHKTFVHGVILNINSFDQMGVELGKRLATNILDKLQATSANLDQDSSTNALINFYKKHSS